MFFVNKKRFPDTIEWKELVLATTNDIYIHYLPPFSNSSRVFNFGFLFCFLGLSLFDECLELVIPFFECRFI